MKGKIFKILKIAFDIGLILFIWYVVWCIRLGFSTIL